MVWRSPVIVIGLDAATWEVINPLLASGRLPNIARLIRQGTSGRLHSIIRYPSPALWTSIITGKLPEKHGVQDFYSATRFHISVPTLYHILGGGKGNIGLFRWHATWPPIQNAGFIVPSYIARSPETYPAELKFLNDLARPRGVRSYLMGGFQALRHGLRLPTLISCARELIYEAITRPEKRKWWYRRRLLETAIYGDVFSYLVREYRPQFACILFSIIDDLGHHYWKYREPELFNDVSVTEAHKYGGVIDTAYIAVDRAAGVILQSIPEDTVVIALSDHGQRADPSGRTRYRISQSVVELLGFQDRVWVTELGYTTLFRSRSAKDGSETLNELRKALEQIQLQWDRSLVFRISSEDASGIWVKVRLAKEMDMGAAVSLPDGRLVRLGDVVSTRGQISGQHSEWGILLMRGPGIRKGHRIERASILDVTPTILALRGQPIARDMDGQVLVDVMEAGFLEQRPVRYIESYEMTRCLEEGMPLTSEEREELEAKLRALGYLS